MKTVEEIQKEIEKLEMQMEDYERYGDDEGNAILEGRVLALRWVLGTE